MFCKKKFATILFLSTVFIITFQCVFMGISVSAAAENNPTAVYEAENAESDGTLINDGTEGYKFSGKAYLVDNNEYCAFTINIPRDGFYSLKLACVGYFEGKILLDNAETAVFNFEIKDSVGEYTLSQRIFIARGERRLELSSTRGYFAVDYLSVRLEEEADLSQLSAPDYALSNSNATQKTKELFSYIKSNYGSKIISGQNVTSGFRDGDFQRIKEKTGKLPAMMGLELQEYSGALAQYGIDKTIGYAMEYTALGGIVTLHWHWIAPQELLLKENGAPQNLWQGYRTWAVDMDFGAVMSDETGSGYLALMEDLDLMASQLKRLADADVPVLFRPLHEASGGWFWWGSGGSEPYIKLWRKMYEKFTDEYNLNNLIWVWNGQDNGWYPGDEYVDIVGEDIYAQAKNYSPHEIEYAEAIGYSEKPKVVALTECGVLIDIDKAFENGAVWSWFLNWSWIHTIPKDETEVYATDENGDIILNSKGQPSEIQTQLSFWSKVYNDDRVITLADLPFHSHLDNDKDKLCDVCGGNYTVKDAGGNTNYGLIIAVVILSVAVAGLAAAVIALLIKK